MNLLAGIQQKLLKCAMILEGAACMIPQTTKTRTLTTQLRELADTGTLLSHECQNLHVVVIHDKITQFRDALPTPQDLDCLAGNHRTGVNHLVGAVLTTLS